MALDQGPCSGVRAPDEHALLPAAYSTSDSVNGLDPAKCSTQLAKRLGELSLGKATKRASSQTDRMTTIMPTAQTTIVIVFSSLSDA